MACFCQSNPRTRRSCSVCTSARRRTSCRVASTNRSSGGARVISSSSCRSASGPSSCIIDHRPQPVIQRRQIRQQPLGDRPAVQGPAPPSPPAPAASPGAVCRNAASTDSHNRCGSRSSRPAGTRATRSDSPAAPAWPIQDRSSTVFPLPGPGHVITDVGSLDMTKRSRDLVERGAVPSSSGSGQVTGPAGGDPRAQRRRGSGLCRRTWPAASAAGRWPRSATPGRRRSSFQWPTLITSAAVAS